MKLILKLKSEDVQTVSDRYSKTNAKKMELPKFDPEPSGEFAYKALRETHVKGILIGRLAVWAWVEDPARQAFTKGFDIAISQGDQPAIISYLTKKGFKIRELSIGGFNITDEHENIKVDFIHRNSIEWGDLSRLFEEAIEKSIENNHTVAIGEKSLFLVPVEYLISMKIGTAERKDEDDAKHLLEMVDSVDINKLRDLMSIYLGPIGKAKLENILREVGHPEARSRGKYVS